MAVAMSSVCIYESAAAAARDFAGIDKHGEL